MDPALLALLQKSYATGWLVAAPIGPVNLEIIRRGLQYNLLSGFLVGVGACCIDATYLSIFSAGLGAVLEVDWVRMGAFVIGGAFLCWLGFGALMEARAFQNPSATSEEPEAPEQPARRFGNGPLGSFLVGLAMTASNPMTIAFWSALSLEFSDLPLWQRFLASGAVLAGCFSWVSLLIAILAFARQWVGPRMFAIVTFLGGVVVLYFGVSFIARGVGVERLVAGLLS